MSVRNWLLLGLTIGCVICPAPVVKAQATTTFTAGQNVEVKKGATWYRATVVKVQGTKLLVHFEGTSADFDEWVEKDRVREAAVTLGQGGAGKPAQGTKPDMPKADEDEKPDADPTDAAAKGKIVKADAEGVQDLTPPKDASVAWSVKPDVPPPATRRLAVQPITLHTEPTRPGKPSRSFWERMNEVYFASPEAARAIVPRVGNAPGSREKLGRIECIDLALGKSVGFAETPASTNVADLSPDGSRVLLISDTFSPDKKQRVDIGAISPKAAHVVSFKPYDSGAEDVWRRNVDWARFVDNTHVLTVNGRGELILWEIPTAKAVYLINIEGKPALSPGRKYITACVEQSLCFFDSTTGKLIGRLPEAGRGFAPPVFRPDGKQVALAQGRNLKIWDAESGKALEEIMLPAGVSAHKLDWVADDYILAGDRYLIDCRLRAAVWEYEGSAGRVSGVFGGKYWYLTDRTGAKALASVVIPEPAVRKQTTGLKADQIMAVKPGLSVSLEVNIDTAPEAREAVIKALTAKLKANGLTLADNQPLKLTATTSPGETRQITYQFFGRREPQTISVTEMKYRLAFERDGSALWEAVSTSTAPHFISLQKDQTVEQLIEKQRATAWKFLESTAVPRLVPDLPEKTVQGRSKLTARGLETTPGRPEAASR